MGTLEEVGACEEVGGCDEEGKDVGCPTDEDGGCCDVGGGTWMRSLPVIVGVGLDTRLSGK